MVYADENRAVIKFLCQNKIYVVRRLEYPLKTEKCVVYINVLKKSTILKRLIGIQVVVGEELSELTPTLDLSSILFSK